ncbi:MAG: hypothetical protein U0L52_08670, partial [Bacteroidaceae bacterium]|nr:hypothetical protein [Bacteroidaceae bacterium]
ILLFIVYGVRFLFGHRKSRGIMFQFCFKKVRLRLKPKSAMEDVTFLLNLQAGGTWYAFSQ